MNDLLRIHRRWDIELALAGHDVPLIRAHRDATDDEKRDAVRSWEAAMVEALTAYATRTAESGKVWDRRGDAAKVAECTATARAAVADARTLTGYLRGQR